MNDLVEEKRKEHHDREESSVNEQETQEKVPSSDEVREDDQILGAETKEVDEKAVEAEAEEVAKEQITPAEAHEAEEAEADQEPEAEEAEEDDLSQFTKQLQAIEQEAKEHYDARLRLQAEFNNFKKRKEKEIFDFRKYANESLIQDILPIVDDFERAIAAAEQTHKLEDFLKGVELIFSKFLAVLEKKGVREIDAAEGQPFNPEIHEAVTQIESDEVEEGAIVQVFQKGYYLHERVLRAPKVGVAKKKE